MSSSIEFSIISLLQQTLHWFRLNRINWFCFTFIFVCLLKLKPIDSILNLKSRKLYLWWFKLFLVYFCYFFGLFLPKLTRTYPKRSSSDHFTNHAYTLYVCMLEGYSNVKFLSCSCCLLCLAFVFFLFTYVCACVTRVYVVMKYCISFIEYYTYAFCVYLRFGFLNWYCSADDRAMPLPTTVQKSLSLSVFAMLYIFHSVSLIILVDFTLFRE